MTRNLPTDRLEQVRAFAADLRRIADELEARIAIAEIRREILDSLAATHKYDLGEVVIEGKDEPERLRFAGDVRCDWCRADGSIEVVGWKVPDCVARAVEFIEDHFVASVEQSEPTFDERADTWTIEIELRPRKARAA